MALRAGMPPPRGQESCSRGQRSTRRARAGRYAPQVPARGAGRGPRSPPGRPAGGAALRAPGRSAPARWASLAAGPGRAGLGRARRRRRGAAGMAAPAALQRSVVSPAGRHTASLIFLHGSGDTGQGARAWIKQILNQDMAFQHIKVIYPTAPARPYTPMKGALSTVWFDRYKISNDCPEHIESIDSMCQRLTDLLNDEIKNGIAKNRILIGGFSMGGGMAMHLAYRFHQDLAGVFALSSFLNKDSAVYQALKGNESVLPELFQCHGTADELVLYSWGEETNTMLKMLGVATSLHTFPNLHHELNRTEIEKLKTWIVKKLPVEAAKNTK